ncbi:FAD-dependent oxidoreductase [Mycetocola manganoxydans]|nr:FAD-dependent oxidoreductase [Mycetocola manganoxydans]GHD40760.1 fused response regulator/thioredoxin-disulfide reductase [Mycetocola manganoxydans]
MARGDDRSHPIILVCAANPDARERLVDELHTRYSADYEVMSSSTAAESADLLRRSSTAERQVALVLSDDLTEDADDVTVFDLARRLYPDVRRGLVVRWGSWVDPVVARAIFDAMTRTRIDYYVVLPRHTPDEYFHRTVTEFLLEWERAAGDHSPDAIVFGRDSSPRVHEIRRFLSRAGIRFRYAAPGSPLATSAADDVANDITDAPAVLLADGRLLLEPTNANLADAVGLTTALPAQTVDLAIIGAGPGGLAAAVYAASEGLDTLVLERESIGGQAGSSSLIRNYLGFSRGVSGAELSERAYQQAWVFGAQFAHTREAVSMRVEPDAFELTVAPGDTVRARSIVLASGVSYRRLAIPALDPWVGSAVFYGASAVEAKAQTGRIVHVVGGGNSAGQAALHLARYAASVSLIVRSPNLAASMSAYLIAELAAAGVAVITETRVVGGGGDGNRLEYLVLRHRVTGEEESVPSNALFITIGAAPHTGWLPDEVLRDRWGFVWTGSDVVLEGGRRAWSQARQPGALESSVPGLFAIGDVRRGSVKRVASAVGEGSVVISSVHAFLAERSAARG